MGVLIVEGVTGSGKSSTIQALQRVATFELFDEEATFDDFMTAFLDDPDAASDEAARRLSRILDRVEINASQDYVLERFHFSPLALGSDWKWYRAIDQRCAALGCKVALLEIGGDQLASRSLYRAEYGDRDWQNFIAHYGTESKALEAIRESQERRIAAIEGSALEHRRIRTDPMDWTSYAAEITDWAFRSRHRPAFE